jgi:hypothetical protein
MYNIVISKQHKHTHTPKEYVMSIDITRITALAETLPAEETADGMSAYGVWKAAKEVFDQLGLEFKATSQTFYNAAKNGSINGMKDSRQRFSETEVEYYIAKLVARATR